MAVLLIVVQTVVLDAGGHSECLHALHVGHHHAAREVGVLAHVFEVASAEWRAIDVHAGAQYHVLATIECFLAQAVAVEPAEVGVPGGGQARQCGEGHTGVVGLSGLLPLVPKHVGAHAVRAVIGPEVGEAQTLHSGTGELALCMDDIDLLGEGHALQRVLDTLLNALGGV